MSNFTGVTFAKQRVTPSDDAIIRRAILSDGKLTGCDISYSGSTLTMAPGQLLVCGRQIRHPSVQNWAVVDATSGFARLVLTVDLTRAATKETFEQVETSVEYASAEDGFVELEQSDINSSGIRYQVALCVVSLGVGGITGIVSQLEKCEAGGSGGLNFNVVGGLTQPANLKENSIWVITDVPITTWIFSPTQPEPPADGKDGPVWFLTGTSSQVAFNALKKHVIELNPMSAKQYIGGAWVNVEAKSYQNGVLETWATIVLDKAKQAFDFIVDSLHIVDGEQYSLITDSGDYVEMTAGNGTNVPRAWQWKTAFDLSKYSLLEVTGYSTGGRFGIANSLKGKREQESITEIASVNFTESEQICTIDISQITSVGYIGFYASKDKSVFVKQIRLL